MKNSTGKTHINAEIIEREEIDPFIQRLLQKLKIPRFLQQILISTIVDFFNKEDEIRSARRDIRRTIMMTSFDDENLIKIIMDEFMELAKVKFQ